MKADDLTTRTVIPDPGGGQSYGRGAPVPFDEESDPENEPYKTGFRQAKECLRLGKLSQALTICDELLAANPAHPLFIGLRLQVENRQWQQRVDYLKELRTQLDQISNIEWQVTILQEALARNPNEPQLLEVCQNAKRRRDLVNYVVGSAKKAENSRDYRAAIERWAIVREFHPAYPNLDQEILKLQNLLGHENPTQVVIQLDANQATPVVQEHTSVTATPARLEPEPIPERLTFDIPDTIHSGVPRDTSRKAPDELTSKLRKTQLKLAVAAQNLQSSSEESPTTAKQPEPEPTVKPVVTTDDVKIPTAVENFRAKRRVQANALRAFPAIRDQSRRCFMALQRVSSTLWNRIQTGMTWVGLPETGFVRYALFFFPLIVVLAFIITPGPTRKQQAVPAVPLSQFEVSIRATPDGTQLVLNNGLRGTTRIAPRLNVGPYTLTASAPGYISQSTRFLVRPGMSHLEVALKPEPLAIRLNAKVDWGTVSVDHSSPVPLDAGSFELNDVQPGSHTLEFEAQMSKLRMNFEFRPGEPVSVGGVSGSTNVGALVTSSLNGKTRVSCTCTPTTVAVDGKMVNVSASGLELALSPGEHRFEVGSLNGREYRVVAGISPALTISILSAIPKMLVAADSRSKVDPNPETDLLEVRGLMAEKQYVAAESKLVRVLSTSPENEAALRIRKDLDTVRRLDPESWK